MVEWPDWWLWEQESSPHLMERMVDRQFNEVDLQLMLEQATGYHENHEAGRWVIESQFGSRPWHVIVEPIEEEKILVVVTAYPVN